MAFPKRLLTEGEEIILDLRPHWVALVGPAFWTVVFGVAAGLVWAYAPDGSAQKGLRIAAVAAAFIAWVPLAGVPAARWRFTQFVLSNERLLARSGVIAKHAKEIPLEAINDVSFDQTIIERIIGAGDLVIESAGERGQSRFTDIRHPEAVQLEIYKASEARKGGRSQSILPATPTAPQGGSVADELAKLAGLRDRGVLTPEEFESRKRRLLEG